MFGDHNILAVIPARGGSKGIPGKNLQKVGDKSLVEWALFVAQDCDFIDRIIVSSDSREIIEVVRNYGEYAPFIRPPGLSLDDTPSLPVFQHALQWAENQDKKDYNYLLILEPTCPFRLPEHIKQALSLAIQAHATSVMSLVKVGDYHPIRMKRLGQDGQVSPYHEPEPEGLRRQDQEDVYVRNGAIYVLSRDNIVGNHLWGNKPYGLNMDSRYYGINIDEPTDLYRANGLYTELAQQGDLGIIDIRYRRTESKLRGLV